MSRKTILPNIAYDTQRRSYYVTIRRPAAPGEAPKRTVQCYPTLELAIQALDRRGGMDLLNRGEDLEKLTLGGLRRAVFDGDVKTGSLMCGQTAGLLHEIRPLRIILEELCTGCRDTVRRLAEEV